MMLLAVPAMRSAAAPTFDSPLTRPPLDGPLVLNGGFGEYRSNHFHAGVDLGTGHQVGKPVHAPLAGWIERVRASGIGYGRGLYLHSDDGRLLVFGHLDAYADPVGAFVDSAQNATGQYEQDLWPAAGRFRVTPGQVIAWSGESGAGGPHLHLEIRRGDMAYHPMRAGLAVADTSAPTIDRLTLEPLDDASYVERSAAPLTVRLGSRPETLRVIGRVRAVVSAHDLRRGVRNMTPWWVAMEFGAERVACQFDSVSWATDMVESGYLYDDGRVTGDGGLVMWAPAGFRPRVMRTSSPDDQAAGTLTVHTDDGPRVLRLIARGVNGRECVREVVLRPPPAGAMGPDTSRAAPRRSGHAGEMHLVLAPLPDGYLRVSLAGAPAGSRDVSVEDGTGVYRAKASPSDEGWSVIMPPANERTSLVVRGRDGSGHGWEWRGAFIRAALAVEGGAIRDTSSDDPSGFVWTYPPRGAFEPSSVVLEMNPPMAATSELASRGPVCGVLPPSVPMRKASTIRVKGSGTEQNVGLYRSDGSGWDFVGRDLDSDNHFVGESRRAGYFGVFADTLAPRIATLRPARRTASSGPYPRWSLRARLTELGSGLDARATRFEVDGRRVPSEWDAEERILRWRPRVAPTRGAHTYVVIATDRAGNGRRAAGRFTVD